MKKCPICYKCQAGMLHGGVEGYPAYDSLPDEDKVKITGKFGVDNQIITESEG